MPSDKTFSALSTTFSPSTTYRPTTLSILPTNDATRPTRDPTDTAPDPDALQHKVDFLSSVFSLPSEDAVLYALHQLSLFVFRRRPRPNRTPKFYFYRGELLPRRPVKRINHGSVRPRRHCRVGRYHPRRRTRSMGHKIGHRKGHHGPTNEGDGRDNDYSDTSMVHRMGRSRRSNITRNMGTMPRARNTRMTIRRIIRPGERRDRRDILRQGCHHYSRRLFRNHRPGFAIRRDRRLFLYYSGVTRGTTVIRRTMMVPMFKMGVSLRQRRGVCTYSRGNRGHGGNEGVVMQDPVGRTFSLCTRQPHPTSSGINGRPSINARPHGNRQRRHVRPTRGHPKTLLTLQRMTMRRRCVPSRRRAMARNRDGRRSLRRQATRRGRRRRPRPRHRYGNDRGEARSTTMILSNNRMTRSVPIRSRLHGRPRTRRTLRGNNPKGRRGRPVRYTTRCGRRTTKTPRQERSNLLLFLVRRVYRVPYCQRKGRTNSHGKGRRHVNSRTSRRVLLVPQNTHPTTRRRGAGLGRGTRRRKTNTSSTHVTMNPRKNGRPFTTRRLFRFGSGSYRNCSG